MLPSPIQTDQDVKLRHRIAMTVAATTTTTSPDKVETTIQPTSDSGHEQHSQDTSHLAGKPPKEPLIGDHCSRIPSELCSNSSSSVKNEEQRYMSLVHRSRTQTLSESSDESLSNEDTLISDSKEYKKKSVGIMRPNDIQHQASNNAAGISTSRCSSRSRYFNLFVEVAIRVLLCYGTAKMERTQAFKRIIQPEEVWLYKNPMTKDYVPASTALFWIIFAPFVLIISSFLMSRDKKDFTQATSAFTLAIVMNGFLTSLLKVSVGRPRPDFFYRCFPDGVMGESFDHCSGDPSVVEEGRKSFPSGHSSMSFAGFGFMSFYLASKLHIFNDRGRGQAWRLCVALVPLFFALEVAVSRTCDYHHHWQDVLAGSLIGICVSYLCYRQYYPSVFARNCHRAYSRSGRISANHTNNFISTATNAAADDTDENQPLMSGEKDNKWI